MANTDVSVFVDTSTLASWSTRMSSLNEQSIDNLKSFMGNINSLKDSWAGNSAESFINSSSEFMNNALSCHEKMKQIDKFLLTVIDTMEKE